MNVAVVVLNEFRNDSRVEKVSRSLASKGFVVSVYATAGANLPKCESKNDYEVIRPYETTKKVTRWGRILSSICLFWKLWKDLSKIRIIHCNDLEPLAFCILLKVIGSDQTSVIYDAHELETEKEAAVGLRKILSRIAESILIKKVDGFMTVSPSIASWYQKRYDLDEAIVILNCPYLFRGLKKNLLRKKLNISDKKTIVLYQGGFSPRRGIPQLIEVFSRLEIPVEYVLVFLGSGTVNKQGRELQELIEKVSSKNEKVYYHPSVPYSDLLEYTASADIGICLTEDSCLSHRFSLPNKIFEYAMTGLPLIASDLPEMRRLVKNYKCGILCNSSNASSIEQALRKLVGCDLERMSSNSLEMAQIHCWENQEKKLISLYQRVLRTVDS